MKKLTCFKQKFKSELLGQLATNSLDASPYQGISALCHLERFLRAAKTNLDDPEIQIVGASMHGAMMCEIAVIHSQPFVATLPDKSVKKGKRRRKVTLFPDRSTSELNRTLYRELVTGICLNSISGAFYDIMFDAALGLDPSLEFYGSTLLGVRLRLNISDLLASLDIICNPNKKRIIRFS